MSDVKWIKGPWFIQEDEDSCLGAVFVGPIDDRGIMCQPVVRVEGDEEAHLIAAAPDLYDALVVAREYVSKFHTMLSLLQGFDSIVKPDLEKCDKALAKARGES